MTTVTYYPMREYDLFDLAHWRIKVRAVALVAKATRDGRLPTLDGSIACQDCGEPAAEYDHRDYTKPLDVTPVCRGCNARRGPGDTGIAAVLLACRHCLCNRPQPQVLACLAKYGTQRRDYDQQCPVPRTLA